MIVSLHQNGAGDITVLPIWPYKSSPAIRVIISARKDVNAPFTLLDGLVLHHPDGGLTSHANDILQGESVGLMSHILSTPQEGVHHDQMVSLKAGIWRNDKPTVAVVRLQGVISPASGGVRRNLNLETIEPQLKRPFLYHQ